jgi:hypothetical protein
MDTDAEETLLRHLADLKQLVLGAVGRARDIEGLRTVVRQLFASVELCPPERPFGHGAEGRLLATDDGDAMVGSYRLLIRMRPEMVDELRPVKAAIPEIRSEKLTRPPYRAS